MNRRLCRYSFIRFLCLVGFFWLLFVIYMTSWNSKYLGNVVNQKFYDIDVEQMIQGKLIEVVEQDLLKERVVADGDEFNYDLLDEESDDTPKAHVEVDDEIKLHANESIVKILPKPQMLKASVPKPTLSPEILDLQRRLNLTDPGRWGAPVILPSKMEPELERMLNKSREKCQINEFVANLIPLDRELPDIRTEYCKNMTYSEKLPMASVIMVFHNEALSMILRTVYSILNRSPEHLLKEIILIDDCSDIGDYTCLKTILVSY